MKTSLLYITNVWCLPTGAQTHGYCSWTSYYASANRRLALDSQKSSCFYNLRPKSKSPVASSVLHNYLSPSNVSRKAHLSVHQLLRGKTLKPVVLDTFHSNTQAVFLLKNYGYLLPKNLEYASIKLFRRG